MIYRISMVLLLLCCSTMAIKAQSDTGLLYKRFPTVPPFKLFRVPDSTIITKDDLKKNKATLIMIFSPDCEHCQHETQELVANIKLFKKIQIVMASPLEFDFINRFYEVYKLESCPNIMVGRDPSYFLGTFYRVRSFPALFLYDKKGNFVQSFDGSVPVEKIAAAF
ncbi:MAG: thioredoxin family protein [Ferruginibacter sp.]